MQPMKEGIRTKLIYILSLLAVVLITLVALHYAAVLELGGDDKKDESALLPVRKALKIHSSELQTIVNDLQLTDAGLEVLDSVDDVYLYYRQPSIQAACGHNPDAFDDDVILEGCYTIADADVYFIDRDGDGYWDAGESIEINGDVMVISDNKQIADTMAHEFLHAVYIRPFR